MTEKLYSHFGFQRPPFAQNVPPERLLSTPSTEVIKTKLLMTVEQQLFTVLSGEIGTGKSTQLRVLASSLPSDRYRVIYVACSGITPRGIYVHILQQLGVNPAYYINELRWQLREELKKIENSGHQKVAVIIDEAHLLDAGHRRLVKDNQTTEEIRYLRNSDYDSGSSLALILAGQPEIWDERHLGSVENQAIAQRVDMTCRTELLSEAELKQYICAHLSYAGAQTELFSAKAIELVGKASGGIPRVVNKLCTQALLYAAIEESTGVTDETISRMLKNAEFPRCVLRNRA